MPVIDRENFKMPGEGDAERPGIFASQAHCSPDWLTFEPGTPQCECAGTAQIALDWPAATLIFIRIAAAITGKQHYFAQ